MAASFIFILTANVLANKRALGIASALPRSLTVQKSDVKVEAHEPDAEENLIVNYVELAHINQRETRTSSGHLRKHSTHMSVNEIELNGTK